MEGAGVRERRAAPPAGVRGTWLPCHLVHRGGLTAAMAAVTPQTSPQSCLADHGGAASDTAAVSPRSLRGVT